MRPSFTPAPLCVACFDFFSSPNPGNPLSDSGAEILAGELFGVKSGQHEALGIMYGLLDAENALKADDGPTEASRPPITVLEASACGLTDRKSTL